MTPHAAILLSFLVSLCAGDQRDALISQLEQRVSALEAQLTQLESDLVRQYGLVRRCPTPSLLHGSVTCLSEDKTPGTKCSAHCEPGFIVTPGKGEATCEDGGTWDVALQCEVPLLVVSGGTVDGNQAADSGVEVVSFHNSTGCSYDIPDMPLTGDGEHRIMHNLIYVPPTRHINHRAVSLLACNGLAQAAVTTCDSWVLGDAEWKYHSNPNKGSKWDESRRQLFELSSSFDNKPKKSSLKLWEAGRYAAASLTMDREPFMLIIGGMIFNATRHIPTKSVRKFGRRFDEVHWSEDKDMKTKRAFFCAAEYKPGKIMVIGGYSGKVEDSVQDLYDGTTFAPLTVARSGHACAALAGGNILVSGGSRRDGARAMAEAEMWRGDTGRWEAVAGMASMRFGHAMVNVGGKVVVVGGKERQPDVVLDTAEVYDPVANRWSSVGKVLAKPRANFGYTLIPHSLIPGCKIYEN